MLNVVFWKLWDYCFEYNFCVENVIFFMVILWIMLFKIVGGEIF